MRKSFSMRCVAPELAHASLSSLTELTTSLESSLALTKVLREDDVSTLDADGDQQETGTEAVVSRAGADGEAGWIVRMGGKTEA